MVTGLQPDGLPHSDMCGSSPVCRSPHLFAAYHVLLRLRKPRHPPFALLSFLYICTIFFPIPSSLFARRTVTTTRLLTSSLLALLGLEKKLTQLNLFESLACFELVAYEIAVFRITKKLSLYSQTNSVAIRFVFVFRYYCSRSVSPRCLFQYFQ